MLKFIAALAMFLASFVTSPLHASLSQPKIYSEQPTPVQKAIKPEVHVHKNQLRWSLDRSRVQGEVLIDVVLSTLNNFHLYENRMSYGVPSTLEGEWTIEIVQKPQSVKFFDPISRGLVPGYQGQPLFRLKATPKNASAATYAEAHGLPLVVGFQACSDSVCLFPANLLLDVNLKAEMLPSNPEPEASFFSRFSQSSLQSHLEGSLGNSWLAFLMLFIAGVLTAFTPCVYPIYPITIGIFSRWSTESAETKAKPFLLSLLYCLGITASYAVLGLFTAATGTIFGALTQSPFFLIGIGLILFASAVLFSGAIPFTLPASFINRVAVLGNRAGLGPCVGPVLIAVITWTSSVIAAKDLNSYLLGFSYLAMFGLGMSFPFLVMSQMILKMKRSPSFGHFTPWIKRIGTVLLLGSSLYFLIPGFQYLQLRHSGGQSAHQEALIKTYSLSDVPAGVPHLIDFRADWCVACVEFEQKTLRDPAVVQEFQSAASALVKVDLTVLTPENEAIAQKYGVLSLPALLFVDARGELCKTLSTFEFMTAAELLKKLNDPCMRSQSQTEK